jgi:hypothetical protein
MLASDDRAELVEFYPHATVVAETVGHALAGV